MQLFGIPQWAEYLFAGLMVFILLASAAVVLTRAGKSPYFALLLLVPFVQLVAVWIFAFTKWPKRDAA